MFSFINFIQSILKKLKKNKGLWFSILTIASIMGVLVSISLINIMTKDVAHKTYMQVHRVDTTQLSNMLDAQYDSLLAIGGIISIHPDIIANIKSKSDKSIDDILVTAQQTINDKVNIKPISIHYYAKDFKASKSENQQYADVVIDTQTSISGIVINLSGPRIVAITPIMDGNATVGAIEVSQDISVLRDSFEKMGKEFAFIINQSQLVFVNLENKQGMMQDIDENYKIFFHKYNPQFFTNLQKVDIPTLEANKYIDGNAFFTTYDEAIDINGKRIGLFVIGESAEQTDSFVHITQSLISSITTVALGLVISLILFMF
jgi:hypothetical protein